MLSGRSTARAAPRRSRPGWRIAQGWPPATRVLATTCKVPMRCGVRPRPSSGARRCGRVTGLSVRPRRVSTVSGRISRSAPAIFFRPRCRDRPTRSRRRDSPAVVLGHAEDAHALGHLGLADPGQPIRRPPDGIGDAEFTAGRRDADDPGTGIVAAAIRPPQRYASSSGWAQIDMMVPSSIFRERPQWSLWQSPAFPAPAARATTPEFPDHRSARPTVTSGGYRVEMGGDRCQAELAG